MRPTILVLSVVAQLAAAPPGLASFAGARAAVSRAAAASQSPGGNTPTIEAARPASAARSPGRRSAPGRPMAFPMPA